MKKIILLLVLTFASRIIIAQSIFPSVVASSGGFSSNTYAMLSYTIGELTMVQTFSNSTCILTQGFQQAVDVDWDIVTAISPVTFPGLSLKFFPNPTSGIFFISINTPSTLNVSGKLYDLSGRSISEFQIRQYSGQQIYYYDWSKLSNGVYILELDLKSFSSTSSKVIVDKIVIAH